MSSPGGCCLYHTAFNAWTYCFIQTASSYTAWQISCSSSYCILYWNIPINEDYEYSLNIIWSAHPEVVHKMKLFACSLNELTIKDTCAQMEKREREKDVFICGHTDYFTTVSVLCGPIRNKCCILINLQDTSFYYYQLKPVLSSISHFSTRHSY